jgi:ATP-dependent exoDNAse (exonuclease V) alpha subunit
MLLRNLNPKEGLCNGTRLIIKEIGEYVLKAAVINSNNSQNLQIVFIPRINLSTKEDDYPFIMTRKQFPVKLSFAMTINKAQGQSLTNVGIDLRYPVFTHGQLYVALSRSTNVETINILHKEDTLTNTVTNIVYPELLI